MINGTDYVKYIKNPHTPFYYHSSINELKKDKVKIFKTADYDSKEWESSENDAWHYMMFHIDKLPNQGWKIHISANLADAQDVLLKVSSLLIHKKISFKFVPDFPTLELSYSKNADRIEAGKFITIYPRNDNEFSSLLDPLKEITDNFKEGPYILNDRPWKQSNVYYRYGGFKAMTAIQNGMQIFVIQTPDGKYIEDKRVPYFSKPDFVEEPTFVKENNTFSAKEEFSDLESLNIQNALHFSNAGGVYTGNFNGQKAIIKEGRPFIGTDQNQYDGYTRIEAEYQNLLKLKDVKDVVTPLGYKKIWKHNYLIEEKISGQTLGEYMSINFPFPNNADVSVYKRNALKIIKKLVSLVEDIHSHGVAIVDFQPENIIININKEKDTLDVKLIDFESAEPVHHKYMPNLVTQDYTSFQSKTFEDADWYVLNRIARSMFLPVESTMFYSPDLEKRQNKNIAKKFGIDVVNYLQQVQKKCAQHTKIYRQPAFYEGEVDVPNTSISLKNLPINRQNLQTGIIENLNYQLKGLILGDIKQYNSELSWYAINYGAMGVIMALQRSHSKLLQSTEFEQWLANFEKKILQITSRSSFDIGLFNGLSGIALVLHDLGELSLAKKLIQRCNESPVNLDISIYSGLSGLGLVNLALYVSNHDKTYLQVSKQLAKRIIDRYHAGEFDNQSEYEGRLGLIKGWAGPVIFLWKLGTLLQDQYYQQEAIIILDKIIETGIVDTSQGTALSDKSKGMERILPYLDTGFAGLSLVFMEINLDNPTLLQKKYSKIWSTIQKDIGSFCTYQCCLFSGTAGLVVYSNVTKNYFNTGNSLKTYLAALNNFLLATTNKNILVPGQFGEKCTMDYETGAAGILLALLDIEDQSSWVPLLKDNPLNLFNLKPTPHL